MSTLTRVVTAGQEALTGSIDALVMPFQTELEGLATANDINVNEVSSNILSLLSNLANLSLTLASGLTSIQEMENDLYDPSSVLVSTTGIYNVLNSMDDLIDANLDLTDHGLESAVVDALYQDARERDASASMRIIKRVYADFARRLPYSGMVTDAVKEADKDVLASANSTNRTIFTEEAKLTYQFQRDKIKEGLEHLRLKMQDDAGNKQRRIEAYGKFADLYLMNLWKYFEFLANRALEFARVGIDVALKAAGGADQVSFENWLRMSKIMADGQLSIAANIANLMPSSQSV